MTTTATFTKGPWAEDAKGVLRGADGARVGDLDPGEPITPERHAQVIGDRRLQRAAPMMFEAARPLADLVEFYTGHDEDFISVTAGELRALRRAIKLAAIPAALSLAGAKEPRS